MRPTLRRTLLASSVVPLILAGCGGGGSSDSTSTSVREIPYLGTGTIEGFGSVFVNGVRFNTDGASIDVNGIVNDIGSQEGLERGMMIRVIGTVAEDGSGGTADQIVYDAEVKGPISSDPVPGADGTGTSVIFDILGLTIEVNQNTTLFKNTDFDSLAAGDVVEVSGLVDENGVVQATYLELEDSASVNTPAVEFHGVVAAADGSGITVAVGLAEIPGTLSDGTEISDLPADPAAWIGLLVEVEGVLQPDGSVLITQIEAEEDDLDDAEAESEVEVTGYIIEFNSIDNFVLGDGTVVDASGADIDTALAEGLRVRVRGGLNDNDVLVATEVRRDDFDLTGRVTAFDPVAMTIEFDGSIVVQLGPSTEYDPDNFWDVLAVGDFVEVEDEDGDGIIDEAEIEDDDDSDDDSDSDSSSESDDDSDSDSSSESDDDSDSDSSSDSGDDSDSDSSSDSGDDSDSDSNSDSDDDSDSDSSTV